MDVERDQKQESVVEFSVDNIRLVNDGRGRQKATFYVQNRCNTSRKVRVAVERGSDPVSCTVLSMVDQLVTEVKINLYISLELLLPLLHGVVMVGICKCL